MRKSLIVFAFSLAGVRLCASAQQPGSAQSGGAISVVPPVSATVTVVGQVDPATEAQSQRSTTPLDAGAQSLLVPDVPELLRDDASVDVEQRGGAGVQQDVAIRGSSYEQTLVLVNGLRINDAETSHFNLDVPVPLEALGGVYVLHGAGSTLYGSDAVSGVVNLTTERPGPGGQLRLRAGAGSFGGNQEAAVLSAGGHKASEVLAGGRDFSEGFMADRDYRSEELSSETRFTTKPGESDVLLASSDRAFGANGFYGSYPSWERTKSWFAGLTQQLGAKWQAALAYRRHTDEFVLFRNQPSIYENNHIDSSWQGVVRRRDAWSWHKVQIDSGIEENADQINSTNLGRHGRNRGAGYVQVQADIVKRLSATVGAREEVFSGGRSVFVPSFAVSDYIAPAVKLRGAISRGFRVPTYNDLYYSDPANRGNPNLLPESAWSYEGGADWYPNAHWGLSVTGFTSRQKNVIDYVRSNAAQPYQAENLTEVNLSGAEAAVEWRPAARQQVRFSFSGITGAAGALNGLESKYVFNYPSQNGVAEWHGWWKIGVGLRERVRAVHRVNGALYAVVDSSASFERGRVRPYVQASNLTDAQYQEIAGVPMPGRAFLGGVEVVLGRKR